MKCWLAEQSFVTNHREFQDGGQQKAIDGLAFFGFWWNSEQNCLVKNGRNLLREPLPLGKPAAYYHSGFIAHMPLWCLERRFSGPCLRPDWGLDG